MATSFEALAIWLYALPGFIGVLFYEALAETHDRTVTDKIGLILVFSLLSAWLTGAFLHEPVIPAIASKRPEDIASIMEVFVTRSLPISSAIAACIGVIFAAIRNRGFLYHAARFVKITRRIPGSDPWHQASKLFHEPDQKYWVKVRFDDGCILVGWAKYFSDIEKDKQLFLAHATWHFFSKGPKGQEIWREEQVVGPGVYVPNLGGVRSVEIVNGTQPHENMPVS